METNPYAAPVAPPLDFVPGVSSGAEAIRREHIKHEASVKGLGSLYLIGAFIAVVGGATALVGALSDGSEAVQAGLMGVLIVLGILGFWVGLGIRKLNAGARIVAGVLTGLNLVLSIFALPSSVIAVLINTYILNLLFSKKGAMVFSTPYKDIIAATPHVKYKTSMAVWIILGILVLVIVGGVAALLFSDRR
jgi:hypothetical protein